MSSHVLAAAAVAIVALAAPAAAKVVLINQARALQGSVSKGDAPGYPISITEPGTYRLTGKLVAPAGKDGIVVSADNVIIDLNGNTLTRKTAAANTLSAIRTDGAPHHSISVSGGIISNFWLGIALYTTTRARVERMSVDTTGNGAVYVGINSVVNDNIFGGTSSFGIQCPSVVTGNVFTDPGNNGLPTATCAKVGNVGF